MLHFKGFQLARFISLLPLSLLLTPLLGPVSSEGLCGQLTETAWSWWPVLCPY